MYNKKVIDRFLNPSNAGGMRGSDVVGKYESEATTDVVKLYFKINEETFEIEKVQFKTFGSPATIACSDAVCEMLIGKTLEEAERVSNLDIINFLGELPMDKIACATTVENAVHNAIDTYRTKLEKQQK